MPDDGSRSGISRRLLLQRTAAAALAVSLAGIAPSIGEAYQDCDHVIYHFQGVYCYQVGTDCYGNPVCAEYDCYATFDEQDNSIFCGIACFGTGNPCPCP